MCIWRRETQTARPWPVPSPFRPFYTKTEISCLPTRLSQSQSKQFRMKSILLRLACPTHILSREQSSVSVRIDILSCLLSSKNHYLIIFFNSVVRRKTIYEYHRVDMKDKKINNFTAIYLKALPRCNMQLTCESCLGLSINIDDGRNHEVCSLTLMIALACDMWITFLLPVYVVWKFKTVLRWAW